MRVSDICTSIATSSAVWPAAWSRYSARSLRPILVCWSKRVLVAAISYYRALPNFSASKRYINTSAKWEATLFSAPKPLSESCPVNQSGCQQQQQHPHRSVSPSHPSIHGDPSTIHHSVAFTTTRSIPIHRAIVSRTSETCSPHLSPLPCPHTISIIACD
jgi:hypothetical protein